MKKEKGEVDIWWNPDTLEVVEAIAGRWAYINTIKMVGWNTIRYIKAPKWLKANTTFIGGVKFANVIGVFDDR